MLVVVKARTGMNKNGASSEQYVVHTLLALPLATWDVGSAESGDGRYNRTSPILPLAHLALEDLHLLRI